MNKKLGKLLPAVEIELKAELVYRINKLKIERGAIILGHNYMEPALYTMIPDAQGDSLELSRIAATTEADPIIFCGVQFMAETAKILNPKRTVLIPSNRAGCSLAASITAHDVRMLRQRFPGVPIVTYINTYTDVKAEVDVCCTSSNAMRIVGSLDSPIVIFLPDRYLGQNVANEMAREFRLADELTDTEFRQWPKSKPLLIGWRGVCEVHEKFTRQDILDIRKQFPTVAVLSHPECPPEVVAESDYSGSTSAMIRYVQKSRAPSYLLLTECSMGDNIAAENPDKEMLRLCSVRCPHMNQITLEDTLAALEQNRYVVEIDKAVRIRAKRSLDRMLALSTPSLAID